MITSHRDNVLEWWWPTHWLRMLYSVWIDQQWYWQHIHPYLNHPRYSRAIFIQGLAGTLLSAMSLSAAFSGLIAFTLSVPIWWDRLLLGVALGAGAMLVSLRWGVARSFVFITSQGLLISVECGLLLAVPLPSRLTLNALVPYLLVVAVVGLVSGIAFAVDKVLRSKDAEVDQHLRHQKRLIAIHVLGAILFGACLVFDTLSFPNSEHTLPGLIGWPLLTGGLIVGMRVGKSWATRQLQRA